MVRSVHVERHTLCTRLGCLPTIREFSLIHAISPLYCFVLYTISFYLSGAYTHSIECGSDIARFYCTLYEAYMVGSCRFYPCETGAAPETIQSFIGKTRNLTVNHPFGALLWFLASKSIIPQLTPAKNFHSFLCKQENLFQVPKIKAGPIDILFFFRYKNRKGSSAAMQTCLSYSEPYYIPSVPYIFCSQKRYGMTQSSHGMVKTNRLPCPGAGSTDTVPWCSSAMARTRESPRPEPPS